MANTLKNNAYHILGLDTSASQKIILKRSKEIINRLKIDDYPEYALDMNLFKDFRTEEAVKEAVQRLQTPKKRIKEYFFWFQIGDDIDAKALTFLQSKDYSSAIHVWEKASEANSQKSHFYKINLAILLCLSLFNEDNKSHLQASLVIWKDLITSDQFWDSFSATYKLHDEQTASQAIVIEFRSHIIGYLSDLYTELHQSHHNADYINEFQKIFSAKSEKMEKAVLAPVYTAINDAVIALESMKVSEDGIFDDLEREKIKKLVGLIQVELNKLIDLGLYEDSQTKVMRDRVASALRSIAIDLNNNLNETGMSLGLSKIANTISGTDSFKTKTEQDLKTIQGNFDYQNKEAQYKKIVDPILDNFKSGKSKIALNSINEHLANKDIDAELKADLQEIKKSFEERLAKYGKPISSAPPLFTLNGFGTKIYGDTLYFVVLFIPIFPLGRFSLTNNGNNFSFLGQLPLHKWQKVWMIMAVLFVIFVVVRIALNS